MSHLADHARAMRTLGEALIYEGGFGTKEPAIGDLLAHMGQAHVAAADQLDREIREAAQAHHAASRCTVDHRAITAPKCPACGNPKGSPQ